MIKVEAIQLGYFNHERRREGDVFFIQKEEEFSEEWMKRLDDDVKKAPVKKPKKVAKPVEEVKADLSADVL